MITGDEILDSAFDDFGEEALVNGVPALASGAPFRVIPQIDGRTVLVGEFVEHTGPQALSRPSHVAAINLAAGNDGDVITISEGAFRVLSINPEASGLAVLSLERTA